MVQDIESCIRVGSLGRSFGILTSEQLSSCHRDHVESEPLDGEICLSILLSINLFQNETDLNKRFFSMPCVLAIKLSRKTPGSHMGLHGFDLLSWILTEALSTCTLEPGRHSWWLE